MSLPPRIKNTPSQFDPQVWRGNTFQDPAAYLIDPGQIRAVGSKPDPGMLAHARPYIASGKNFFAFPVGVEGFRRSGSAQLGLHHYIGDNAVAGITMHREEGRIELSGMFPGITSQDNMVDCLNILCSVPPDRGLVLVAPGVFDYEQFVLAESWDFSHAEDDRTHSITYNITLVKIGTGSKVKDPKGIAPPPQPGVKVKPKGKPHKIFKVRDGARTLKAISKIVYGNANKWQRLVDLNRAQFAGTIRGIEMEKLNKIPTHTLPYYRWPIGMNIRYQ